MMTFLAGCWLGSTLVGLAFAFAVWKGKWVEKPAYRGACPMCGETDCFFWDEHLAKKPQAPGGKP